MFKVTIVAHAAIMCKTKYCCTCSSNYGKIIVAHAAQIMVKLLLHMQLKCGKIIVAHAAQMW
jgi:hypothetical protein